MFTSKVLITTIRWKISLLAQFFYLWKLSLDMELENYNRQD